MSFFDASKAKPAPIHSTLILLNNFIVNTAKFLNGFSENVDKKLSNVSSRITQLEFLLGVVEAKLNSIPELQNIKAPTDIGKPAAPPATESAVASTPSGGQQQQPSSSSAAPVAPAPPQNPDKLPASSHPSYIPFLKMLKVGVPPPVVADKLIAAGLNPAVVDNPEMLIDTNPSAASNAQSSAPAPPPAPAAAPMAPAAPPAPEVDTNSGKIPANSHPDYIPFLKMLKVGVPPPVVANKLSGAGLDPSVVDNHEKLVDQ